MFASLCKWLASKTHQHNWIESGRWCMVDGNLCKWRVYRCQCGAEQSKALLLIARAENLAEATACVVVTNRDAVAKAKGTPKPTIDWHPV
jgi:hypothetical protein